MNGTNSQFRINRRVTIKNINTRFKLTCITIEPTNKTHRYAVVNFTGCHINTIRDF